MSRRPVREAALSAAVTGTDTPKPPDTPLGDDTLATAATSGSITSGSTAATSPGSASPGSATPGSATTTATATATATATTSTGTGVGHRPGARGRSTRRAGGRHPFTPAVPPAVHEPSTAIPTNGPVGPLRGLITVSGRLVVGAPRVRGISSIDVVEFTAACPACGKDVSWIEEREETRLRIIIECRCDR